jgi:hypothetical protein
MNIQVIQGLTINVEEIKNPKLRRVLTNRSEDFMFNHNDKHDDAHTDHHDKVRKYSDHTERHKDYSDYENYSY